MVLKHLALSFALVLCLATRLTAVTRYVDQDATGLNNGQNWQNAYVYLRDALANSDAGDIILVAEGVYYPDECTSCGSGGTDDPYDWFEIPANVSVEGGYAGVSEPNPDFRHVVAHPTTLSGEIQHEDGAPPPNPEDNAYHVVHFGIVEQGGTLDGFTVTAGWSGLGHDGAGILVERVSANIRNCTISGNFTSGQGGGVAIDGNAADEPVEITNCVIFLNSVSHPTLVREGGGIYMEANCELRLERCSIIGNTSDGAGGGIYAEGDGSIDARNCRFIANASQGSGGGAYLQLLSTSVNFTNAERLSVVA